MDIRSDLRAPDLDEERVDRLTTLCDEIVARVVGGTNASDLIYAFNRETNRVFGPNTFRGVYGAEECEDFVRRILTPLPDLLPQISDAEAEEMVRRIQADEVDDRESWYWVRLLAEHYDQPRFSDLIYSSSRELEPDEVVCAAHLEDDELNDYLEPSAWGVRADESRRARGPSGARHVARRLLQEMSRVEMLQVIDDEAAVNEVALILAENLPPTEEAATVERALLAPFITSDLQATDEEIAPLLKRIRCHS